MGNFFETFKFVLCLSGIISKHTTGENVNCSVTMHAMDKFLFLFFTFKKTALFDGKSRVEKCFYALQHLPVRAFETPTAKRRRQTTVGNESTILNRFVSYIH